MGLFDLLAKTAALPIAAAIDVVKAPLDVADGCEHVGSVTKSLLDSIEDEI